MFGALYFLSIDKSLCHELPSSLVPPTQAVVTTFTPAHVALVAAPTPLVPVSYIVVYIQAICTHLALGDLSSIATEVAGIL